MSKILNLKQSPEVVAKVRKELGLDEKRIKEAVQGLKDWLELQPHLPKEEDDARLERWLIRCKNNVEKVKQKLDIYYSLRNIVPEVMCSWDVNEPWFEELYKYGFGSILPVKTDDCDSISLCGLRESNPEIYNVYEYFKMFIMMTELRTSEDYYLRDIIIMDLKNYTIGHAFRMTLPAMRKLILCSFKGYGCRIKEIHLINTPPYADVIISIFKSIANNKMLQRFHVHRSDLTEFYKHVPKRYLPAEYGGELDSIEKYHEMMKNKLLSHRDWFVKREKIRADESKRPRGKLNDYEIFGVDGSFRRLEID